MEAKLEIYVKNSVPDIDEHLLQYVVGEQC